MHNKVSTNHYPFKDFKPHGLVEFCQREHTLLTTATGPFNEEIIEAHSFMQQDYINKLTTAYGQWYELVEFENSCMATPGALEKLMVYFVELRRKGIAPAKTALVIKEGLEGGSLLTDTYCNLYKRAGMVMNVFKSKTAALNWLAEEPVAELA
ncbi:hypothetical protein ACSFVZ_07395 [Pseudoalteromonas sp. SYSU M81236]|jgi:hypothetical protein|uniref:hypothetical protein n=1 Tax=Pseudoalteromonas sp. SYSU M81236 TaxID=3447014 RepID=UPI003F0A5C02